MQTKLNQTRCLFLNLQKVLKMLKSQSFEVQTNAPLNNFQLKLLFL